MIALIGAILHQQIDALEAMPLARLMMWHKEAFDMAKVLHGNGSKEDD